MLDTTAPPAIYCEYDNRYYIREQLAKLLARYFTVMVQMEQPFAVASLDGINEDNIGHIVYHAEMCRV